MHLERTADATLPPPFCIYFMYFGQDGCQVPNGHFPEPTYIKVDGYGDCLKNAVQTGAGIWEGGGEKFGPR